MNRRGLSAVLAGLCGFVLSGCSALTAFNTLTPRDPANHVGRDLAYGPDPRQTLDVYTPEKPAAAPAPMLIFFYGGGWTSGRRQDYGFAGQALASRGFVTVVPDYRLAPQHPYPDFVTDAASAVRWARDHAAQYGGDPGRILLVGHSAGAYLAIMLAMDDDFLKSAGVDFATLKGAVGLSGPYDFYPFDVDSSRLAFGQYPDPAATQPITYASRPHRPPVLLIQGEKDKLVAVKNSVNLDRALKAAGNPVTLRLYPGLSHSDTVLALSVPFRGKAPILNEVTAFLEKVAAP
jgi:acetyl esterase/lipase